jgi:hypothetical protein
MLILIAAGAAGLPYLTPGPERMAGWAALVVAVCIAVWTLRPRPRHRAKSRRERA